MIYTQQDPGFRRCAKTVMDNIADPDITFDEAGISNYVYAFEKAYQQGVFTGEAGEKKLAAVAAQIKAAGKGKPYDCLIGLSGGVDSSYVAWLTKQLGLRPLAVHLDNGWNSELAVQNIENIVNRLGIDLHTLVVNWEEFRDIQLSYLKASVVDIEVVSDHAILATMYRLARKFKINYILTGTNIVTEEIMPPSWIYKKIDLANLQDIHRQYGQRKIKTYPTFSAWNYIYFNTVLRLTPIPILNYIPYNKQEVKKKIQEELGWRDYGGKHYESVFTKFYQAYILPEKFHIDKRKAHLSTLICSGQMTREQALQELEAPLYDPKDLAEEKAYVLKKLGLSEAEFSAIMQLAPRPHSDFKSDTSIRSNYIRFLEMTKPLRKLMAGK